MSGSMVVCTDAKQQLWNHVKERYVDIVNATMVLVGRDVLRDLVDEYDLPFQEFSLYLEEELREIHAAIVRREL
jgi:hypothetical protein